MNTETKHTPGPWAVQRYANYIGFGVYAHGRGCIAERWYDKQQDEPYGPEILANARLIAAAPDLLLALEDLVNEIRAYSSPECDDEGAIGAEELKAADAAIAKAKGERPRSCAAI